MKVNCFRILLLILPNISWFGKKKSLKGWMKVVSSTRSSGLTFAEVQFSLMIIFYIAYPINLSMVLVGVCSRLCEQSIKLMNELFCWVCNIPAFIKFYNYLWEYQVASQASIKLITLHVVKKWWENYFKKWISEKLK